MIGPYEILIGPVNFLQTANYITQFDVDLNGGFSHRNVSFKNLLICDFRPTLKNWEKINGSVLYPARNSKAPISFGNIFSTNTVKKLTK